MNKILTFLLAFLMAGIDQAIKMVVRTYPLEEPLFPIGHLFYFYRATNTGMAFSLLSGIPWLVNVVSVLFIAWLIVSIIREQNGMDLFFQAIVLGGCIGNIIDRFFFGGVTDYIMCIYGIPLVFNFADVCIVCGTIFYMLFLFTQN